jgi:hypothetical protein
MLDFIIYVILRNFCLVTSRFFMVGIKSKNIDISLIESGSEKYSCPNT